MHLSVGVGNARADRCGPLAWWLELSELDATNAASSSRVATVTAAVAVVAVVVVVVVVVLDPVLDPSSALKHVTVRGPEVGKRRVATAD